MAKFKSLKLIVKLVDGEVIESDALVKDDLTKSFKESYPREKEISDEHIEHELQRTVDIMSQINKLFKVNLIVEGDVVAINPSLVKTIRFKIEREK